ncbi:hypothetical protein MHYMCMPSP_01093 [Hyalomma marginatum]|uniref:Uncharacterized protein n=1 Tax=Hyalomma marginatum TaxID=34627 RepID=A0A8S4BXA4_9ACAR|nr:hypothetical protein MHYMCMPSP_01093 [Hyalomma marginatum]CAG7599503.1 hypothetical protein MHYMCMPASI_01104 [Hyalomma marginatum]
MRPLMNYSPNCKDSKRNSSPTIPLINPTLQDDAEPSEYPTSPIVIDVGQVTIGHNVVMVVTSG